MTSSEYRKVSVYLSNMRNGSRDSFADIFMMYEKKVYFLCCKLLKSKSDAKKLTVDIFDYTYVQIASFRNAASFDKWLYNTTAVKCRRFLIDNHPEMFGDYIDTVSPDGDKIEQMMAEDAEEMAKFPDGIDVSVEMMQTMDSILSEMPLKLRTAALQYYFSGLEFEDIAASEQISVAALKNRLVKARIRLKTEEHKYCGIGYSVQGIVTFLPEVLSTMADSIVVPSDLASAVTSRTGVNCLDATENTGAVPIPHVKTKQTVDSDATTFINVPVTQKKSANNVTTNYAVSQPPKKFSQNISPSVKVLMAIVAILIIIGGTVAVVLAVQSHKNQGEGGSVANIDNTTQSTTIEITTKAHTTEKPTETTTAVTTTETTTAVTTTETTTQTTTETTTQPTTETTTQTPVVTPDDGNFTPEPVGDEF